MDITNPYYEHLEVIEKYNVQMNQIPVTTRNKIKNFVQREKNARNAETIQQLQSYSEEIAKEILEHMRKKGRLDNQPPAKQEGGGQQSAQAMESNQFMGGGDDAPVEEPPVEETPPTEEPPTEEPPAEEPPAEEPPAEEPPAEEPPAEEPPAEEPPAEEPPAEEPPAEEEEEEEGGWGIPLFGDDD